MEKSETADIEKRITLLLEGKAACN